MQSWYCCVCTEYDKRIYFPSLLACLFCYLLSFQHTVQKTLSKCYRVNKLMYGEFIHGMMYGEFKPSKHFCKVSFGTHSKWLQDWLKLKWRSRLRAKRSLWGWNPLFWDIINGSHLLWDTLIRSCRGGKEDVFPSKCTAELWEMCNCVHVMLYVCIISMPLILSVLTYTHLNLIYLLEYISNLLLNIYVYIIKAIRL